MSFSIDDQDESVAAFMSDLDAVGASALLSSTGTLPPSTSSTKYSEHDPSPKKQLSEDDEFLSWLENDSASVPEKYLQHGSSETASGPQVKYDSVESLLIDVFGNDAHAHALASSSTTTGAGSSLSAMSEAKRNVQEVHDILFSHYPDTERLRDILLNALGYIPSADRASIWQLLLSGSTVTDSEADSWHLSEGQHEVFNKVALVNDCQVLMKQQCDARGEVHSQDFFQDFCDLLSLFCARSGVEYTSIYSILLSPLMPMCGGNNNRSGLSSCYYALCNDLFPLLRLPVCLCLC